MATAEHMSGGLFAMWVIVNLAAPVVLPIAALAGGNALLNWKKPDSRAMHLACKDGQLLWLLMAICPAGFFETCLAWPGHMTWIFLMIVGFFLLLFLGSAFVLGVWTVGILTSAAFAVPDNRGRPLATTLHREKSLITGSKWALGTAVLLFLVTKWVLEFRPEALKLRPLT